MAICNAYVSVTSKEILGDCREIRLTYRDADIYKHVSANQAIASIGGAFGDRLLGQIDRAVQ